MLIVISRVVGAIAALVLILPADLSVADLSSKASQQDRGMLEWNSDAIGSIIQAGGIKAVEPYILEHLELRSQAESINDINRQLKEEVEALRAHIRLINLDKENVALKDELERLLKIENENARELVPISCDAFLRHATDNCPNGMRLATLHDLERCKGTLCSGTVPRWGIVNGQDCSLGGSGYSCEVSQGRNEDGGETICIPGGVEGQVEKPIPVSQNPDSCEASPQEGSSADSDVLPLCNTMSISSTAVCTTGRLARFRDLKHCQQLLCSTILSRWSLVNGDKCSIGGKGYDCDIQPAESANSGEYFCVGSDEIESEQKAKNVQHLDTVQDEDWSEVGITKKRNTVRQMMRTAWEGYRTHAWGENELKPKSRTGLSGGIFGPKMGASIVDSLDTLHIMNLTTELQQAREWVRTDLHVDMNANVSVFETIIRFIGGLLSAFALTKDEMYRDKAEQLAAKLVPAFATKTGVPTASINLMTGQKKNWGWAPGRNAILSEFGTLQLEFEYLSDVTGNATYRDLANDVIKTVFDLAGENMLIPNYLDVEKGLWGKNETSLGPYGDSFYEYLLKVWIYRGGSKERDPDPAARITYDKTMAIVRSRLHRRATGSNYLYVADLSKGKIHNHMWHLTCFVGGLYALSAMTTNSMDIAHRYQKDAADITFTCRESYAKQPTRLGPERMEFDSSGNLVAAKDSRYILRPETVESYFYLWRSTHDEKYRQWAWDVVTAIERNCRCGVGYCGIQDVKISGSDTDNIQQSFFLAETLKYLFLILCDDDVLPLDKWVFNTEAHPFPIRSS